MDKKEIAVLIPCYNESKTIKKVIKDYKKALPEAKIYVYDNNSSDNTAEIARKAGAIVRHEYRQSWTDPVAATSHKARGRSRGCTKVLCLFRRCTSCGTGRTPPQSWCPPCR